MEKVKENNIPGGLDSPLYRRLFKVLSSCKKYTSGTIPWKAVNSKLGPTFCMSREEIYETMVFLSSKGLVELVNRRGVRL